MNRLEFMDALESRLSQLSSEERDDALRYYEELFDEAGPIEEQKIIDDLGSPEDIARQILVDNGVAPDGRPQYMIDDVVSPGQTPPPQAEVIDSGAQNAKNNNNILIIMIIVVLTFPLWIGVLGTLFGVAVGLIGTMFGLTVGVTAAGAGLLAFGIAGLFSVPQFALIFIGAGLILISIDILLIFPLIKWFIGLVPKIVGTVVSAVKKLTSSKAQPAGR